MIMMRAVLRPDAAVHALAVPHLQMRALACPAALLMFVAVGAFRGFKDTTYALSIMAPIFLLLLEASTVCVLHKACLVAASILSTVSSTEQGYEGSLVLTSATPCSFHCARPVTVSTLVILLTPTSARFNPHIYNVESKYLCVHNVQA